MQRLLARLDIKNGAVIKGIHLEGQRRIGDPVGIARDYYAQGIDEIVFMDSVASLYGRSNLFDTIAEACRFVFVPITMGGGIRDIGDVERALASGADKVAVNTALVHDPALATRIAAVYGSQCLVGSIEAKRTATGWEAYVNNGREPTGRDVLQWARELEERGVGELLVTSVDQEGTKRGFDVPLHEALSGVTTIPVIASGGAGSPQHLHKLEDAAHPQGIAIASLLHYRTQTVEQLKAALPRTTPRHRSLHAQRA